LSSNSSGYSSNESCVVNEGIADINEDADCSSQSVTIVKHTETHLNENTRSTEKHLNMDKNSSKIHPIVKMSETTPENEGVGKDSEVTVEQCDNAPCEEKIELDDVSSSSSTSKTSDANRVGINVGISSVDTINESSLVAEKNVTHDGESQMPHILYNLYTISVSILTLYSFLFFLFSFIFLFIHFYLYSFLFIFLFYIPFYSYLFFFIFIFIYVSFIYIPF
jgi:hypothetical protein